MYSRPSVACVASGTWKVVLSLLSCCDLSLLIFGVILYSTKKFHCLIPPGARYLSRDSYRRDCHGFGVESCHAPKKL